MAIETLPGFGHQEVAVGGIAERPRRDVILMEDGGGIADAMDGEGADDEGSAAVLFELFEQLRTRGDLAIFDVEEVRGGAALPEFAVAAVDGVEQSDVFPAKLGGEILVRRLGEDGKGSKDEDESEERARTQRRVSLGIVG